MNIKIIEVIICFFEFSQYIVDFLFNVECLRIHYIRETNMSKSNDSNHIVLN